MKTALALVFLAACAGAAPTPGPTPTPPPATAAQAAPPAAHRGKFEEFPSQAGNGRAYVSLPDSAGKHPAIVVIQEWWGVDDWILGNADRFAGQGYVAYAVDLYRGKVATTPEEAHELMRAVPEERGMADLEAGIDRLLARPDVDASRVGAVGWCFGGGYALQLAAAEPRLKAIAVNYGHLLTAPASIQAIKASLLGNFGEKDGGIGPADVGAFDKSLHEAGKEADIKVFPGVGHAFMNPNNTKGYDEASAREAWARIDAFFAKKLKAGS